MNAENGSAIFGKGKGKIIIDPSQNDDYGAVLFSSNYYSNDRYGEDGLPSSYGDSNTSAGMMINLSKPYIKFGSGNFSVNSQGYLVAKGGGSIAGWEIEDNELKSYNDTIILNSGATEDTDVVFQAGDNFEVQANGILIASGVDITGTIYAESGEIGDFTIGSGIYSGQKKSFSTEKAGVYIGTDGISLGDDNQFQVTSGGILTAVGATIKGAITATSAEIQVNGEDTTPFKITKDGTVIGKIFNYDSYVDNSLEIKASIGDLILGANSRVWVVTQTEFSEDVRLINGAKLSLNGDELTIYGRFK